MNPAYSVMGPTHSVSELQSLRDYRLWFLLLGLVMIAIGTLAIGWVCLRTVTEATTSIFGFLLLTSGIAEVVNAFWVARWRGTFFHLLMGTLYALIGLLIIDQPENVVVQLTVIIAIFLMFAGIFRIVISMSERFTGWGLVLLHGAITFLLGLVIYKQWPACSLWIIGLFVGIDVILSGCAWIMLAFRLRHASTNVSIAVSERASV